MPLDQTPGSAPEVGAICRALVTVLDRHGYSELTASMSPIAASHPAGYFAHLHGRLPTQLETCVQVFLYGESAERSELCAVLGPTLLDDLEAAAILETRADGRVATADLILRCLLGLWYLHQRPGPAPRIYYGDDSFALLWRQAVPRSGHCLDLCCGPGLQLLHAVRQGASGVGVEIDPNAARLARINAAMNSLDHVRIEHGSLYQPLDAGERFDHVTANPPLLPFPADAPYPFVGHGGEDGFEVAWEILHGLAAVLAPGGTAQIIQTCLSNGVDLAIEPRLDELCRAHGLDVTVTVTAHVPHGAGTPLFEGLLSSSVMGCGSDRDEVRAAMLRHLERHGGTHLAGVFLRAVHGSGRVTVQDVSARSFTSFFFR